MQRSRNQPDSNVESFGVSKTTCQRPNLARARTIPSRWYLERDFLGRDRSHIFRRSWQWVGRTEDVGNVGDFFTTDMAGEPFVIARAADGKLRAFSNVCRHRAGPVAEGKGNRKQLQCAYHGWTYGLDSRLPVAAEVDRVEDFAIDDTCLPRSTVAEWPPLVFMKLGAEGPSREDTFDDIQAEDSRLRSFVPREHRIRRSRATHQASDREDQTEELEEHRSSDHERRSLSDSIPGRFGEWVGV